QPRAPWGRSSAGQLEPMVRGRSPGRIAASRPLRLPASAPDARGASGGIRAARVETGGGLSDPQPDASRAPGADSPRREGDAGEPSDPPGGRNDAAGRSGSLHPRAVLRGHPPSLSPAERDAFAPAPGDAHGRPPGGRLARDHPKELRLHPLHSRAGPRRAGERLGRSPVLRPLRCPGALASVRSRTRNADGSLPEHGVSGGTGTLRAGRRDSFGRTRPQSFGDGPAPPPDGGAGGPALVHVPGGRVGASETTPAEAEAG